MRDPIPEEDPNYSGEDYSQEDPNEEEEDCQGDEEKPEKDVAEEFVSVRGILMLRSDKR